MENKNTWFVHVEWVVVLITLLGGFYLLDGKIERQCCRIDAVQNQIVLSQIQFSERTDKISERSDRLYEMFIQLLKETKDKA